MEPLVSIIIPVYNVFPYIHESVDSVITQTYKNLEIIIVDDGSEDGSERICDEYLDDPRVVVVHQKNRGLSAARNTALDIMHGEIVAFLDSDDAFLPNMIEIMVGNMVSTKSDIVVCSYFPCKTNDRMNVNCQSDQYPLKIELLSSAGALVCLSTERINNSVWNKIYKRELFEGIRFIEDRVFEDWSIMPTLFERASKVSTISDPLIFYRKRNDSISAIRSEKNCDDWIASEKDWLSFVKNHTPVVFSELQKEQIYENQFRKVISYYLNTLYLFCSSTPKIRSDFEQEIEDMYSKNMAKHIGTKLIYHIYKANHYRCHCYLRANSYIKRQIKRIKKIFIKGAYE